MELVKHALTPTVLSLHGALDAWAVADLADGIAAAIVADQADIVIDLRDVECMTIEAVGVLLRTEAFLHYYDRSLVLRSASPETRDVLKRAGLSELDPGTVGYGARWLAIDD